MKKQYYPSFLGQFGPIFRGKLAVRFRECFNLTTIWGEYVLFFFQPPTTSAATPSPRTVICPSLRDLVPQLPEERDFALFGIFDGHGGKQVGDWVMAGQATPPLTYFPSGKNGLIRPYVWGA